MDREAASLIRPSAAKRYRAVPVGFVDGGLLVAMTDPADSLAVNDIAVMTKLEVQPAATTRSALDALLAELRRGARRARRAARAGSRDAGERARRRCSGRRTTATGRPAAGERAATREPEPTPSSSAPSSTSCAASWRARRPSS